MTQGYSARLSALHRADFGNPAEMRLRYGLVTLCALLLAVATRDAVLLIWLPVYLGSQMLYWQLAERFVGKPVTGRTFRLVLASGLVSGMVFVALPLYLLASGMITAQITGAFALIGNIMFTLSRDEPGLDAIRFDCIIFAFCVTVVLGLFLPTIQTVAQQVTAVVVGAGLTAYYVFASFSSYQRVRRKTDAAQQVVQDETARALGQFVGGVAHDFNNQLTAILGHLDLHEVLHDPQERREALQQSRAAADRAAQTVRQLLATCGRARLSPETLSVCDVLTASQNALQTYCPDGLRIEVACDDPTLLAHVDRAMLETSLSQLCLNAMDAQGKTGRIRVSAQRQEADPDHPPLSSPPPHVAIRVEDDGPGVSTDALPKLTEPFYTTKPVGKGTGLGLSAVAGFAEQSGGALTLAPSALGGLCATLILPAVTPDLDQLSGAL